MSDPTLKDHRFVRLLQMGQHSKQPLAELTLDQARMVQAAFVIGWARYTFLIQEPLDGLPDQFYPDAYETTEEGAALLAAIAGTSPQGGERR